MHDDESRGDGPIRGIVVALVPALLVWAGLAWLVLR